MIGCPKKRENYPEKEFEQKKGKLGLKFNTGLALSLRTTRSSPFGTSQGLTEVFKPQQEDVIVGAF